MYVTLVQLNDTNISQPHQYYSKSIRLLDNLKSTFSLFNFKMSILLYVFVIFGIYFVKILSVNGESKICGYNDDSLICCSGYKKDDQGECTLPICELDCGIGGQCIRPYTCYCANGRVGSSCPDENQFENDDSVRRKDGQVICQNNCNGQGQCEAGKCVCNLGYSGPLCLDKVIDTCYVSPSRGLCQKPEKEIKSNIEVCCGAFNAAWSERCQKCPRSRCERGYMEVDGQCRDVDECTIEGLCRYGRCENRDGSYRCLCSSGYEFDRNKGDCVKIEDSCKQVPSVCGPLMQCVTLPMGKYICQCVHGYVKSKDQKSCVKQNLFNFCTIYGPYVCQYGKCQPDGNNYKCECNPGYIPSSDYKSCKKNIDYCSLYQSVLCLNGECVSINDDYFCKCNRGYTLSFDRKKCTSVCDVYSSTLCPNAKCIPQFGGGYECQCNEGYSAIGKGKQCRRVMSDQSAAASNIASTSNENPTSYDVDYCSYEYYIKQCNGGRCENKKGYYKCECLHGYVTDKNGLACTKIDIPSSGQMLDMASLTELKSYCDKYGSFVCTNGHCVESGSSYQCRCNRGYQESSDGKTCYDIDECALDSNICVKGVCTNSPGSYQCSCFDGFTIHYVHGGPKCYDRNDCEEDGNLCPNGQCKNTWGSYTCVCNQGYVISNDGKQCVPVLHPTERDTLITKSHCKNCRNSCKQINNTHYQCECPSNREQVLNTGLCAPMIQVVDIQFDTPTRRQKRSIANKTYIFFELVNGTDKSKFADKVSSMYNNINVDQCSTASRFEKEGIICEYHESST